MSLPPITELDPRYVRGQFIVKTASGAVYYVDCSKNVAGKVTISGGSFKLPEQELCLGHRPSDGESWGSVDPTIRVGESMRFANEVILTRRGVVFAKLTTSPVVEIVQIDEVPEKEISAKIASLR